MQIAEKQANLIKLATEYVKKLDSLGIDVSMSSFCYMNAQEITPGYRKLKNLQFGQKFSFKYFLTIIRHIFSISTLHRLQTYSENFNENFKFRKLII